MNCPKHEQISAYIDDMLAPPELQQFRSHLAGCPVCGRRLDELRGLRHALRDLPSPILGFDLAANLEWQTRRTAPRRPARPFWTRWGAPGLAVALSVASGAWLGGMLVAGGSAAVPLAPAVRVFDPVPPGGLCAAAELCSASKGLK